MNTVGCGLVNLGNTCFFNAVLQCLLHAQPLSKILHGKIHSKGCSTSTWCVFCQLEKVWERSKQQRILEPLGLVRNLQRLFKKFRLGRQEDAHEFLRYFVEGLQKAQIGDEKKPERRRQLTEQSNIFKIFGGKMKSSIQCLSCHAKSEITEHFYDMSLECQKSNSVAQSLDSFFKIDLLSGNNQYRCGSCKKLSNAHKRFLLHQLPLVLTIQLKRFTNSLSKLNKFVKYDPVMNLTKYCDNQQKVIYQLYGVVVHAGSTSFSGHYYSFIHCGDYNWYRADDNHVSRSSSQQVASQKSYLLFYRLKQENARRLQVDGEAEDLVKEKPPKEQREERKEKIFRDLNEQRKQLPKQPIFMKKAPTFLEDLERTKTQCQPLLTIMERHFSIQQQSKKLEEGHEERKMNNETDSDKDPFESQESDDQLPFLYSPSASRPLIRRRSKSQSKALRKMQNHKKSIKKMKKEEQSPCQYRQL